MMIVRGWTRRARWLKRDTYALFLACRDPRTPLLARILGVAVVAYAFSPIDLIPDFIPILGALDDLILVPLGIAVVLRMIPPEVIEDARSRADVVVRRGSKAVAVVVVLIWIAAAALLIYIGARTFNLI